MTTEIDTSDKNTKSEMKLAQSAVAMESDNIALKEIDWKLKCIRLHHEWWIEICEIEESAEE